MSTIASTAYGATGAFEHSSGGCTDATAACHDGENKYAGLWSVASCVERGFWLYIWKVGLPEGDEGHYVGMTGDTGAARAQSAANHIAASLGFSVNASALRRCLQRRRRAHLEDCRSLDFFSFGPVYQEPGPAEYSSVRGKVIGLANGLWDRLGASGYDMLNVRPPAPAPLDVERWNDVYSAYQSHFPKLRARSSVLGASAGPRLQAAAALR